MVAPATIELGPGGLSSGEVQSGNIASGAVQGFFGSTRHIASGTVGAFDFGSGAVIAGTVGSGAIVSGNVASGQIASGHLASGLIDAITASVASGAVQSGDVGSGSVFGFFGPIRNIASGTVGVSDFGSGAVIAGAVGSGAIVSGSIASGQVGTSHLADESVTSGDLASGSISTFKIASGGLLSGAFGSGQIGQDHLGSGAVRSGAIASGQVSTFHLASGADITQARLLVVSGTAVETISGGRAVDMRLGDVSIYDGGAAERVFGLVLENYLSGEVVRVYMQGLVFSPVFSGDLSTAQGPIYATVSGTLTASFPDPTVASGLVLYPVGYKWNASGIVVNVPCIGSGDITSMRLNSGVVLASHIGSGAVVSGRIASGQIGTSHLADASVTSGDLASGAISTFKVASGGLLSGAIGSGQIGNAHLGSGAVLSGHVASGQIGSFHLADESVTSGDIASGSISTLKVASGGLLSGAFGSGQIGQDHIGSGGVVSGHIASGQVGQFHVASGSVTSGRLGVAGTPNGTLFLRDDFNWATAASTIASGDVSSGEIASGAVQGFFGATRHIASGTVGVDDFGSGAVLSGHIASGQVGPFKLSSGAVQSGQLASGVPAEYARGSIYNLFQVFGAIASGTAVALETTLSGKVKQFARNDGNILGIVEDNYASGDFARVLVHGLSRQIAGWPDIPPGGGPVFVASGGALTPQVAGTSLSISGLATAIVGFAIAGTDPTNIFVLPRPVASGYVRFMDIGSGAVASGHVGSGQIGRNHLASGSPVSVLLERFVTAEAISGLKAVALASGEGRTIVRAERASGLRLPAFGITTSGAVSGTEVDVVTFGRVSHSASGMIASGFHGQRLYVGSGGLIVNHSGFMEGASSGPGPGFVAAVLSEISGSLAQRLGYAISGGIFVQIDPTPTSGLFSGLLGQY